MRARLINESKYVSKFRPGMQVNTKTNKFYIKKVEEHSPKFDILTVYDNNADKIKLISSDWLEQNGEIYKSEIEKKKVSDPTLTTKQYEKEIKAAVSDLRSSFSVIELEKEGDSYIWDCAESLIYDRPIYNYLVKKYKKNYNEAPLNRTDLVSMLADDMMKYL